MSNDTIKYFYIMQSEYSNLQKYCLENNINIQFISDSYNISSKIHRPIILTVKVLLKNFDLINNYFINELEYASSINNYYKRLLTTKEYISKADSSVEEYMFWYFDSLVKDRLIFKNTLCFYHDLKLIC